MFKSVLNTRSRLSFKGIYSNFLNSKLFSGCNHQLEFIKMETPHERVGLITLNRPKAKNALCNQLVDELNHGLYHFENDNNIAVVVLAGHTDYFCAGADLKEMKDIDYSECYKSSLLQDRDYLSKFKKPVIGVVNGVALGGGCEIAMMCDILIAGSNALFGQPEIIVGTIPGMGGSQRLTRIVGKSRAMEMILTGEPMKAEEALQRGLVSRVVEKEKSLEEGLNVAKKIASKSIILTMKAKDVVNAAYETTLTTGIAYEKRVFWASFATQDRKIGMTNFANKVKDFKFTDN